MKKTILCVFAIALLSSALVKACPACNERSEVTLAKTLKVPVADAPKPIVPQPPKWVIGLPKEDLKRKPKLKTTEDALEKAKKPQVGKPGQPHAGAKPLPPRRKRAKGWFFN